MTKRISKGFVTIIMSLALVLTLSQSVLASGTIVSKGTEMQGTSYIRGYANYTNVTSGSPVTVALWYKTNIVRSVETIVPTYSAGTAYSNYVSFFSGDRVSDYYTQAFVQ